MRHTTYPVAIESTAEDGKFSVTYDDGEEETLNMNNETWNKIESSSAEMRFGTTRDGDIQHVKHCSGQNKNSFCKQTVSETLRPRF